MRTKIIDFEKRENDEYGNSEDIIEYDECNVISSMNTYYKEDWVLENMFN